MASVGPCRADSGSSHHCPTEQPTPVSPEQAGGRAGCAAGWGLRADTAPGKLVVGVKAPGSLKWRSIPMGTRGT